MRKEFSSALRALRTHPGFSSAVVILLGIAIGACVAVFGLLDRLMLRPLPFSNASQLVTLEKAWPLFVDGSNGEAAAHLAAPYSRIARYDFGRVTATAQGPSRVVRVAEVSGEYFELLAARPSVGRFPAAGEMGVVAIGASLRRLLFADDSSALGQSLTLNGQPHRIIGVAGDDFAFYVRGEKVEAWIPRIDDKALIQSNQQMGSGTVARLRPGVSASSAESALQRILQNVSARHPELRLRDRDRITVISLREHWYGALRTPLLLLLGAAGSLLAIAVANVTGLMLARVAAARRDAAIRIALGASRADLFREAIAEALLLGGIAAGVGLMLAAWGTRLLISLSPARIPGAEEFGIGLVTIIFALMVALPATSAATIVAVRRASRVDLLQSLGTGGRRGAFVSPGLRRVLVAAQVGLSVTLLINATLLLRSYRTLRSERTGFDAHGVLTMEVSLPSARYPDAPSRLAYYQRMLGTLKARQATGGIVNFLPLFSGSYIMPVMTGGRGPDEALSWSYRSASADYFKAMRIPIVAGRAFTDQDRIGAPNVAIVDRSAAQQLVGPRGPIQAAIGQRIVVRFSAPTTLEVIGIADDIRQQGLGIESYPGFYVSAHQRPPSVANLVVRMDGGHSAGSIRGLLQEIDGELPVGSLHDMESTVTGTVSRRRFAVVVTGIFGASAVCLSLLGLGALMSQLVTYRTHEIGVRVALGAQRRHVLGIVVGQGLGIVAIGIAVGVGGAFAVTRLLAGLLYGVTATDPIAFVAVPAAMLAVATLACAHPASRAVRSDPMLALRGD